MPKPCLDLETTRSSAATGTLELAALRLDVGFLVLVGAKAKVLESLTGVLGATDQQGVAAGGGTQSQLVEGQGLATGGDDAAAGGSGESQSGDGHLGDLEKTVVIRDGADNDDGLVLLVADLALDAGQGNGGSVDPGHKEAAEDDLVEGRVGSAGQEPVKLHQELEVHIVALGRLAVGAAHVVTIEINAHLVVGEKEVLAVVVVEG